MSSPAAVAKPTNSGSGQTAIANTNMAFANVRNGPGTAYRDVGDLRDNTLVVYYPASKTSDNWFWIEFSGISGWVAGSVVEFEAIVGVSPDQPSTPYDGKVAIWHWKGDAVPEVTIDELARSLKGRAPNLSQVWVKTSDGAHWQGEFDDSQLAVNSPADIDRWVQTLNQHGLEFHAWCVPQGLDIQAEVNIITAVCQRPGVKSMILDIEPYAGFWQGGAEGVRPFMLGLRRVLGGEFHIGLSIDPRPWHYDNVFPSEWFPFVNSIHPQCYWYSFRKTPEETLQQAYETWGSYGRPVIPALQGDAPLVDQQSAHTLATQRHAAAGLSWWRYGVISQFGAVNLPVEIQNPDQAPEEPTDNYADEVIIVPKGNGFRSGTYTGQSEFGEFDGTWNWPVLYTGTEAKTAKVWAEWNTGLPESGRYEISTFVPARHATSERARYKVHGVRGTNTEVVIDINQYANRNRWVPLGIFDLEKGQPNAGKVFLNDVTGEIGREVAFDAIRLRRIVTSPPTTGGNGGSTTTPDTGTRPSEVNGVPVADGYDSPIGTQEQRRGSKVWPNAWLDASPFGRLYFVGTPSEAYHTGADLNWGSPYEDKGLPITSCANGVVTFAGSLRVWGLVIVIRHDPLYDPSGQVLYSRYGHVQNINIQVGQRVARGQQIAEIGDAGGRFVPHLHFDISPTTLLEIRPSDWPGTNLAALLKNYVDPLAFIQKSRP